MADHLQMTLVLCILASLFVSGLSLTVDECPTFKDDNDDVTIKVCDDTCYYFYVNEAKTFKKASAVCGGRGGALAMPKSRDVSDFLREELERKNNNNKNGDGGGKAWVGLLQEKDAKSTTYFRLNGQSINGSLVTNILQYGDAYTISRSYRGVWDFNTSDKDKKNNFVCELQEDNIEKKPTAIATTEPHATHPTISIPDVPIKPKFPIEKYFCPSQGFSDFVTKDKNDDTKSNLKFFGDSCFLFVCNTRFTYDKAEEFCHKHKGTLAVVKTAIVEFFLQYTLTNDLDNPKYNIWIGLKSKNDPRKPDVWADGSPVTYTNFRYSFPAWNRYAINGKVHKWEAYPRAIRKNFVCQFKANVSSGE